MLQKNVVTLVVISDVCECVITVFYNCVILPLLQNHVCHTATKVVGTVSWQSYTLVIMLETHTFAENFPDSHFISTVMFRCLVTGLLHKLGMSRYICLDTNGCHVHSSSWNICVFCFRWYSILWNRHVFCWTYCFNKLTKINSLKNKLLVIKSCCPIGLTFGFTILYSRTMCKQRLSFNQN